MQPLSLILILILLLNLLVSIDLVYTGICELVLELVQKENNCSLRFIRIFVVQKLQVVTFPEQFCLLYSLVSYQDYRDPQWVEPNHV